MSPKKLLCVVKQMLTRNQPLWLCWSALGQEPAGQDVPSDRSWGARVSCAAVSSRSRGGSHQNHRLRQGNILLNVSFDWNIPRRRYRVRKIRQALTSKTTRLVRETNYIEVIGFDGFGHVKRHRLMPESSDKTSVMPNATITLQRV